MKKFFLTALVTGVILVGLVGVTQATPITQTFGYFDVTFFNTGDINGGGHWTDTQMTNVGYALLAWDRILNIPGRNIQVAMVWAELDVYGEDVLGSSGSIRVADGTTIWNAGEYVWKEEEDLNTGLEFDTMIQFDITAAGNAWNFGQDDAGAGEIDLMSVTSHEIGHSLGWSPSYDYQYDDFGGVGDSSNRFHVGITAWDANLIDETGNRPAAGSVGGSPNDFNETGDVYFDGASASAFYGDRVPIYSPDTFQAGSSLSHLDEGTFANYLMSPSIGVGQTIREVSELEWAMMEDMGWTIKSIPEVPEPSTLFLFATGLIVLAGVSTRRHKRQN